MAALKLHLLQGPGPAVPASKVDMELKPCHLRPPTADAGTGHCSTLARPNKELYVLSKRSSSRHTTMPLHSSPLAETRLDREVFTHSLALDLLSAGSDTHRPPVFPPVGPSFSVFPFSTPPSRWQSWQRGERASDREISPPRIATTHTTVSCKPTMHASVLHT